MAAAMARPMAIQTVMVTMMQVLAGRGAMEASARPILPRFVVPITPRKRQDHQDHTVKDHKGGGALITAMRATEARVLPRPVQQLGR